MELNVFKKHLKEAIEIYSNNPEYSGLTELEKYFNLKFSGYQLNSEKLFNDIIEIDSFRIHSNNDNIKDILFTFSFPHYREMNNEYYMKDLYNHISKISELLNKYSESVNKSIEIYDEIIAERKYIRRNFNEI